MADLRGRRIFITGASRGIGLAIALRCARDGARIAIAAKTDKPHPKLEGTIHTAAEQIRAAGGEALPLVCDIRDPEQVQRAVDAAVEAFGGIDVVVNNASAISLTSTEATPIKRWDLMHQVNARGTFLVTQTALPHLKRGDNPHILTLSPPLDLRPKWFAPHLAYSIAKYGMSLCTLGWAEELRGHGIAANSLWPRTLIHTAAIRMIGSQDLVRRSRKPEIMGDAAYAILRRDARQFTGNFCIDDLVLWEEGVRDFSGYATVPGTPDSELLPDLFLPENLPAPGQ